MNREQLINVYTDTCEKTKYLNTNSITTKHSFVIDPKIYGLDDIIIDIEKKKQNYSVVNTDTISAAIDSSKDGKTCILNMASYKRPGGGVAKGAMAQEESIFRCSTLNNTITPDFYPLEKYEVLYTKDAKVFKDRYFQLIEPFNIDCVTVAAINLNIGGQYPKSYEYTEEYEIITRKKIKMMLSLASKNEVDNLILGAWGCGVFKNEPARIAQLFKEELEYDYKFKKVIFAIINDKNSVDDNYSTFVKILND